MTASHSSAAYPRPFGPYVLLDELGRGGMGTVSLACREVMPGIMRQCVVKTLRAGLVDGEYVRRFLDEARVVVRLQHSHICPVFDAGVIAGEHYLAMEYIAGRDLRLVDAATQRANRPLDAGLALHITSSVLEALDYAHRLVDPATGQPLLLVHRDVSPHNVMLGFEGDVRLIDFGLAQSTLKLEKTAPQIALGKIAYMAPEQVYALPLDPRCDQFATAVMAYELLVGERFYDGRAMSEIQTLAAQGGYRPGRFETLPRELYLALDRALQPQRDGRFPSCGEFREALETYRFRAGLRGDGSMLRGLMQQVCGEELAAEAIRQRRYAEQLQVAANAGLTQRMMAPTPPMVPSSSATSSRHPSPPAAPERIDVTESFLGASAPPGAAPPVATAAPRRTMPTMAMGAPPAADPSHTVGMGAAQPPVWAQAGARFTLPTTPMSTPVHGPTMLTVPINAPDPPRVASGNTMATLPMSVPGVHQAGAATPRATLPMSAAGHPVTSVGPTPTPVDTSTSVPSRSKVWYAAAGAFGSAALLVAGMWLGQRQPAVDAQPLTSANATPTASPTASPTAPPTASPTASPTAPIKRPSVPAPIDARVRAARLRLDALKEQCPSSSCIPHFESLLGQTGGPSKSLGAAARAIDLCIAQCAAR